MLIDISAFDTSTAMDEEWRAYFGLCVAAYAVDRPDAPAPEFEPFTQQTANPHPAFGEQSIRVAFAGHDMVGAAVIQLPPEPNEHIALVSLTAHPARRGEGVGLALYRHVLDELAGANRSTIMAQGVTSAGAGDAWARRMGFHDVQRLTMLRLDLEDGFKSVPESRASQAYETVSWHGHAPQELLERYAAARNVIADAPSGESTVEFESWTPQSVREAEAQLEIAGVVEYVTIAVDRSTGEICAVTVAHLTPGLPDLARQLDTAVHPDHRGRGLGLLVKARLLETLCTGHPEIKRVLSNVDPSNVAMLTVNERLGFTAVRTMITYEGAFDELRARSSLRF